MKLARDYKDHYQKDFVSHKLVPYDVFLKAIFAKSVATSRLNWLFKG